MRKTVLIVDNASVGHALCELFDVCGVVENGRETIAVGGRPHPDSIVPDLFVPENNGLDTARAMGRGLPNVPLILYCALDDSLRAKKSLGISEIMSKFDPPSLRLKNARALVDLQVGR